jgi:hypothetical protein
MSESGAGPVIVTAANWLTHLEYEWESPVWRHWIQFFSAYGQLVRYDELMRHERATTASNSDRSRCAW